MHFLNKLREQVSPKITEEELLNIATKKISGLSNVTVKTVEISPDSGKKGDSYLSKICKFSIVAAGNDEQGQPQQVVIPVIAKSLHTNISRRKTFRSVDFFKNEIIFYTEVGPALVQFQKSKNIPNPFNNIPQVLSYCQDGENDYVAFEDLTYQNFETLERGGGLDFEHTVGILKLFTKFHGLGLAFKDQQPQKFEEIANSLQETYFAEKFRSWFITFQKTRLFPIVIDAVKKELPPMYSEKLTSFLGNDLFGRLCKLCSVHGKFSVVTHGDSWVPNFMFKYVNNKKAPAEIMMIDFQLARYTSLSLDITFFLLCCLNLSQLEKQFTEFIEIYYKSLKDCVESLGSKLHFSLDELKEDIKTSVTFGLGMSIENLPMSLLEDDEVLDLDRDLESISSNEAMPLEEVVVVEPFKDQGRRQRVAGIIKFAVDRNFI